jgi:hypothetical protein
VLNAPVKHVTVVELVVAIVQTVAALFGPDAALLKVSAKVLPVTSCGNLVPVNVRVSYPSKFIPDTDVSGDTAVTVHVISYDASAEA